jgi:hypothetical protein
MRYLARPTAVRRNRTSGHFLPDCAYAERKQSPDRAIPCGLPIACSTQRSIIPALARPRSARPDRSPDLEKTGVRVVWPGKIAAAEIFTSVVYFAKPL